MSDCDVCIGGGDYGRAEDFYRVANPAARKPHKCLECGRQIGKGEVYQRVTGKWDGEISTFITCRQCAEIRNVFSCGEGETFGNCWESMEEIVFGELHTANACFQKLSAESKAFLLDRWRKWKFR